MQKKLIIPIYVLIAGFVIWGFINPNGIRAAWANNVWSIKFVNHYFGISSEFPEQNNPPLSHKHATQFLIKQALVNNDYDSATTLISQILDESNVLLMETYAQVLYLKGDYMGSFNVWGKLKQESPLIQAVQYFRETGRNDLVESAYQSLFEINPEKYTTPLAEELRKNNKGQEGLDTLNLSINNFPDSDRKSTWLRQMGDFYRNSTEWDKAESYYLQALEANPDDWVAWMTLGEMYNAHNSDLEKAIYCFKKIIGIIPERGVGYYLIGFYLQRNNANTDALEWFKLATEKEPNDIRYQLSYANTMRDTDQLDKAIELYKVLILQFPEDSNILYEVSWAYWLKNEVEISTHSIVKAIQMNPEKIHYYFRAGDLYEKTGNLEKAKEIYENVLTIDPNNSFASQKLNQINNP